jgi:hypothetical protein
MYRPSAYALITRVIACLWIAFAAGNAVADSGGGTASTVGRWHAVLRLGSSGPVYDEILQQFHADGTELLVSNGLPPALGNVCVVVWRQVGPRTYKLKHMTWNWSSHQNEAFGVQGTFSGHFELEMTLRLDERGREFTGAWSARNFDTSGEHIPALDARGVVNATRVPSH